MGRDKKPVVLDLRKAAVRFRISPSTLIEDAAYGHLKVYVRLSGVPVEWGRWYSPQGMPALSWEPAQTRVATEPAEPGPRPRVDGEQWSKHAAARAVRGGSFGIGDWYLHRRRY